MFQSTVCPFMNFGDNHTNALSQGEDSSTCPAVKWDGNDGEPFDVKIGADPFSSLQGNKRVVTCHSSGDRERRAEKKTEISARRAGLTVAVEVMFAWDFIF